MKKLFLVAVFLLNVFGGSSVFAATEKVECTADPDVKAILRAMGESEDLEDLILRNPNAVKKFKDLRDADLAALAKDPAALRKFLAMPNLSQHNNNFGDWYDTLTADELDLLWKNEKVKEALENKFRNPGKLHEWCMVCKAPALKRAGVKFDQIKKWRTEIKKLKWTIPEDDGKGNEYDDAGEDGGHGDKGSHRFHQELAGLIDKIAGPDALLDAQIEAFKRDVKELGQRWEIVNWSALYSDIWE